MVVPEATETEFISIAAHRADTINYGSEFDKYTTSPEMAEEIWQLYASDFVVGQVDDETYEFHMRNGIYPYKGAN